ncbi:MAG: hypothetical protein ACYC5S_03930 [Thiobacillus sp.]
MRCSAACRGKGGACPGTTAARPRAGVIAEVAAQPGGTPAVCRRRYVHPAVVEAFVAGELAAPARPRRRKHLSADEATLLAFLETQHEARCA